MQPEYTELKASSELQPLPSRDSQAFSVSTRGCSKPEQRLALSAPCATPQHVVLPAKELLPRQAGEGDLKLEPNTAKKRKRKAEAGTNEQQGENTLEVVPDPVLPYKTRRSARGRGDNDPDLYDESKESDDDNDFM